MRKEAETQAAQALRMDRPKPKQITRPASPDEWGGFNVRVNRERAARRSMTERESEVKGARDLEASAEVPVTSESDLSGSDFASTRAEVNKQRAFDEKNSYSGSEEENEQIDEAELPAGEGVQGLKEGTMDSVTEPRATSKSKSGRHSEKSLSRLRAFGVRVDGVAKKLSAELGLSVSDVYRLAGLSEVSSKRSVNLWNVWQENDSLQNARPVGEEESKCFVLLASLQLTDYVFD